MVGCLVLLAAKVVPEEEGEEGGLADLVFPDAGPAVVLEQLLPDGGEFALPLLLERVERVASGLQTVEGVQVDLADPRDQEPHFRWQTLLQSELSQQHSQQHLHLGALLQLAKLRLAQLQGLAEGAVLLAQGRPVQDLGLGWVQAAPDSPQVVSR